MNLSRIPDNLTASDFNFTDCKIAALWGSIQDLTGDMPIGQTSLLLYNGLSGYLSRHPNLNISQDDPSLFIWYLNLPDNATETIFELMENFTTGPCLTQYCQHMSWEGFSDLTGRGMVVNFFVEAGLVTAYLLVLLTASKQDYLFTQIHNNAHVQRFFCAVQESTRTFLDATLIFCIALLLASIKTFANFIYKSKTAYTDYSILMSAFLSFFSIIPAFLLHLAASESLRRVKWRRFMWGFIVALAIIMVALYYNLPKTFTAADNDDPTDPLNVSFNQWAWEDTCEDPKRRHLYRIALYVLGGAVFTTVIVYVTLILNVFRLPALDSSRHTSLHRFHRGLLYVIGTLSFATMWIALGLFMYFRYQLGKLAGESNKDHEWSFGQILGLATWLPVAIELITIWIMGPEHGLTGQVSNRYKVVESENEHVPIELSDRKELRHGVESEEWSSEVSPLAR